MKPHGIICILILLLLCISGCTTQKNSDKDQKQIITITDWTKESSIIFPNTTSTSSIVLSNGTIRTYLMGDGIFYQESTDGRHFGEKIHTNIPGFPTNPAIVFCEQKYILFYNINNGTSSDPAVSGKIQLWRAESTDGKTFSAPVKIADMAIDPKAVNDVPDVIQLPDGRLRIYGTQLYGNGGINTAISTDLGLTWFVDGIELVDPGACDPDVHIENGTNYVMYYTQTIAPEGVSKEQIKAQGLDSTTIRIARSADGVNWEQKKEEIITPLPELPTNGFVIDPDYIKLPGGTEIIYFGQATGKDVDSGKTNVYRAIKTA
jgi:predicted GH43/DUF377 family glycosyl hydrolase